MGAIAVPQGEHEPEWFSVFSELSEVSAAESSVCIGGEERIVSIPNLRFREMVNRFWGISIDMPKMSRDLKKEVEHGGALLSSLASLVGAVWQKELSLPYLHPAFWFRDIYLEAEAIAPLRFVDWNASTLKESVELKKDKLFKQSRKATTALENYKNPFERPATKKLFDRAITYAEQSVQRKGQIGASTSFDRNSYQPYIKTRAAILQWWDRSGALFAYQGGTAYVSIPRRGWVPINPEKDARGLFGF
ncbi:hypothetical protein [Leptolyngbya sp. FACHB-8]|uniref:hypothetical protein n=1 Tax=unclassified Leptolyngbya TaxID=2650499 RepID=UPI0016840626|nr:hypothetical protein [Leptolyngbya sp. FACHB-8]MBD1911266.1 hypothetical protein [Leptolyngbya sp. FACHB-8]